MVCRDEDGVGQRGGYVEEEEADEEEEDSEEEPEGTDLKTRTPHKDVGNDIH